MEPLSGIYAICNHSTGAVYIARALHIQRRWQEHVVALTRGRHRHGALQAAVARVGLRALGLIILERVDLHDATVAFRAQRLRFWLGTSEREWCARARLAGITLYNDRVGYWRRQADKGAG